MEHLLLEKRDGIATITINRPEVRNVLTGEMYQGLTEHLYALDQDDGASVIVIRGAGDKAFCAGSDVKHFLGKTVLERQQHFAKVAALMQAPGRISKPVIAAVRGYAFGGGCALAAACDLAIAAESATLGLPEVDIGIFPMTVAPIIVRRVGAHRAFELLMVGERLPAARAAEIGLINRAVPDAEFDVEVGRWAARIAGLSPVAVRMGKTAFYNCLDVECDKAIRFMGNMIAINASSEDCAEGIAAFFGKRKPAWRGR
ncbi:MAG TPA: enoyl-CoA hydratase-related protein [Candidatus Sulfotelmatobacter sp.]|nr:enoyl-CoA hydratase-related protein [Candidatus Sulfotelmatobacter sp.]